MKHTFPLAAAASIALVPTSVATAAIRSFTAEASATNISGFSSIAFGSAMTLSATYDSVNFTDSVPDPEMLVSNDSIRSFVFTAGTVSISGDSGQIVVFDDPDVESNDQVRIRIQVSDMDSVLGLLPEDAPNEVTVIFALPDLLSGTGIAEAFDAVYQGSGFDIARLSITNTDLGSARGDVTSVFSADVPAPSASAAFLVMLGLGFRRRAR